MRSRIILIFLTIALLVAVLEVVRLRALVGSAHLALFTFRVVEADSMTPIPNYALSMPAVEGGRSLRFPREMSLLRGPDFSLFFSVATQPMTIGISASGYESRSVDVHPRAYESSAGNLPGDAQIITLKRTPKA